MLVHVTARAIVLPIALTEYVVARWFWSRLRDAFRDALAAVLMPDHPHLVGEARDELSARRALERVLAGMRRSSNPGRAIRWGPVASSEVGDEQKARRAVRYLALNPCRGGLVRDPLEWPWSTHRDVVGAVADPWIDAPRLAVALGAPEAPDAKFVERHHRYVSSDPNVDVAGTGAPHPASPSPLARLPVGDLVDAAAAATRGCPNDIRRRGPTRALFLQLAARHGWRDTALLASLCGVTPRAVQQHRLRLAPPGALAAAELCLGDARLRRWGAGGTSRAANSGRRPTGACGPNFALGELRRAS